LAVDEVLCGTDFGTSTGSLGVGLAVNVTLCGAVFGTAPDLSGGGRLVVYEVLFGTDFGATAVNVMLWGATPNCWVDCQLLRILSNANSGMKNMRVCFEVIDRFDDGAGGDDSVMVRLC
jgi:hypothetical protein